MGHSRSHRFLCFLGLSLAIAACSTDAEDDGSAADESGLQAIGTDAVIGWIAMGESVVVSYTSAPLYRVLQIQGKAGDHLDVKLTRAGARAEDMRVWLAHANGAVIRAGSKGDVVADLDRDETVLLVMRQSALEPTTVLATLGGVHASKPLFDLPGWAQGRNLALPLDCAVNGKPFHVNTTMRVEPGTATQPRAALVFAGDDYVESKDLDVSIGHELLTKDLATYYGARAPVNLFTDPAQYGKNDGWGDRLVVEEETAQRFGVFFEYAQGSTPTVYAVHGPSGAIRIDADGLAFSFARKGSNAMDYPNHAITCTGKAAAPACPTCASPHPCAPGFTDVEGACTRPPAPIAQPRTFREISAAYYSTCALDTNDKVTCWGSNKSFVRPETFTQVAAGEMYHCGITTSNELSCFLPYGEHVNWNTLPYDSFTRVAVGRAHACALRTNGTVRCWGSNDVKQTVAPAGTFTDVVAAADHTCALATNGTISCWGNDYRMLAKGPTPPAGTFKKLSASPYLFCALRDTGALVCWGSYVSGIYGNIAGDGTPHDFGGNYVDLAAGSGIACGIDASSTVHCYGLRDARTWPLEGAMYTKLAFGFGHACAIDVDGDAHCFGTTTAATNPPLP